MNIYADDGELIRNRPLERPEVYVVVARVIMKMDSTHSTGGLIDVPQLVHPESCARFLGGQNNPIREFYDVNRESFPPIANSFVNRLIQAAFLELDWTASSRSLYRLNPEKSANLETLTTLETYSTLEFIESVDDADLRIRCESVITRGSPPDSLVREAATVLEDRLRQHLTLGDRVERRNVPAKVLHPDSGSFPVGNDRNAQEDFFYLVRGLLGSYTELHHQLVNMNPRSARRAIAMIDEILILLPPKPRT